MPVRLSELVNDSKTVTVKVDNHEINISYRPNAITMPALLRLDEMNDSPPAEQVEIMAEMLVGFIGGWDILGDNDKPIPVTVDTLKAMPYRLIMLIMDAIRSETEAETLEKKMLKRISADGLPQTVDSVVVQSGIHTSRRQGSFT